MRKKRVVGYHASHEQHSPRDLLSHVRAAELAGFDAAMCSDHFHPWTEVQGESGFAWSWLGAALEATSLSFGTVCAPGWRYHPAIIAQAGATLAQMYPGRFWFAAGSGEALNEHITGEAWPATRAERNARLRECVDIMRALWAGETVTHHGRVIVEDATLYTRPSQPPLLFAAALTEETARWAGAWADGLITTARPHNELTRMIDAFRAGGGTGGIRIQAVVSYARTYAEALRIAHEQWGALTLHPDDLVMLRTPAEFMKAHAEVSDADVASKLRISADPKQHVEWLERDFEAGVEAVYVTNVGRNQDEFIELYGAHVLPSLHG